MTELDKDKIEKETPTSPEENEDIEDTEEEIYDDTEEEADADPEMEPLFGDEEDREKEEKTEKETQDENKTNEELRKEQRDAIVDAHTHALQTDSIQETINILHSLRNIYGTTEYERRATKAGTDVAILIDRLENTASEDELERERANNVDQNLLQKRLITDKYKFVDATRNPNHDFKGKTLSGKEADLVIYAKNQYVKKVWLYNTGIYVVLRGPMLDELNTLYNRIVDSIDEYGSEFGPNFFLFHDFVIKEAICDLIYELLIDSNMSDWSVSRKIMNYISFQDYKPILQAIGSIMYQNKYPYYFSCTNVRENGPCNHTEKVNIDLKETKYNNYSLIPEECREMLSAKGKRTEEDIMEYQENLGLNKEIPIYGTYKGKTKIPSIQEYLDFGRAFNRRITEAIHLDDEKKIQNFIQYNYYKVFAIWLEKVTSYKDDGTVNYEIKDMSKITKLLDTAQLEESDFGENMKNFIRDSAITHIQIPFNGCPSCGYVPDYCKNGFVTFDVQSNFFAQSVMKLALSI